MNDQQASILKRLQQAPATARDLSVAFGINGKVLSNRLYGLKLKGLVVRSPGGRWKLANATELDVAPPSVADVPQFIERDPLAAALADLERKATRYATAASQLRAIIELLGDNA